MMHYDLWMDPGMFYCDRYHRCRRCGQGPLMASDGFLMVHCLNCGSYHCSSEPFDLGLAELSGRVAAWFKRASKRLVSKMSAARKSDALEQP